MADPSCLNSPTFTISTLCILTIPPASFSFTHTHSVLFLLTFVPPHQPLFHLFFTLTPMSTPCCPETLMVSVDMIKYYFFCKPYYYCPSSDIFLFVGTVHFHVNFLSIIIFIKCTGTCILQEEFLSMPPTHFIFIQSRRRVDVSKNIFISTLLNSKLDVVFINDVPCWFFFNLLLSVCISEYHSLNNNCSVLINCI